MSNAKGQPPDPPAKAAQMEYYLDHTFALHLNECGLGKANELAKIPPRKMEGWQANHADYAAYAALAAEHPEADHGTNEYLINKHFEADVAAGTRLARAMKHVNHDLLYLLEEEMSPAHKGRFSAHCARIKANVPVSDKQKQMNWRAKMLLTEDSEADLILWPFHLPVCDQATNFRGQMMTAKIAHAKACAAGGAAMDKFKVSEADLVTRLITLAEKCGEKRFAKDWVATKILPEADKPGGFHSAITLMIEKEIDSKADPTEGGQGA